MPNWRRYFMRFLCMPIFLLSLLVSSIHFFLFLYLFLLLFLSLSKSLSLYLSQFLSPLLSHMLWRLIFNSRIPNLTRTLVHFLILSLPLYLGVFQSTFSLLLRSQSHSLKLTKPFFCRCHNFQSIIPKCNYQSRHFVFGHFARLLVFNDPHRRLNDLISSI